MSTFLPQNMVKDLQTTLQDFDTRLSVVKQATDTLPVFGDIVTRNASEFITPSALNSALDEAVEDLALKTEIPTKVSLGIDKVNNTSDAEKPASTAVQAALDNKLSISQQTLTDAQKGQVLANVNAGYMASFRNKFLNPDISVSQRPGTSVTIPAGGVGIIADRWYVYNRTNQAATVYVQRAAMNSMLSPSGGNYLAISFATAPTSGTVEVTQKIGNVETFNGSTVTLTAHVRGEEGRQLRALVEQLFGTGGTPSPNAGPTTVVAGNFSESSEVRQKLSAIVTLPSVTGKSRGTNGDDCLRAGWEFTARAIGPYLFDDLSIVEGDARAEIDPTSRRHYAIELTMCQHYYRQIRLQFSGMVTSNTVYFARLSLTPYMRAVPDITVAGVAQTGFPNVENSKAASENSVVVSYRANSTVANGEFTVDAFLNAEFPT